MPVWIKVIPSGDRGRPGIQSCRLSWNMRVLLTFWKICGPTLPKKHYGAPGTWGTPCQWPWDRAPERAGHRGGSEQARSSQMQKSAVRNGETRVQTTGPHPRLSYWGGGGSDQLAEDVTTRRAALAAPPRRPSWVRYSALSPPQSLEMTHQTLTRSWFLGNSGRRHGAGEGTEGPGCRLQGQPRGWRRGRHGRADGKPRRTSAVARPGAGLRPLPRRLAPPRGRATPTHVGPRNQRPSQKGTPKVEKK